MDRWTETEIDRWVEEGRQETDRWTGREEIDRWMDRKEMDRWMGRQRYRDTNIEKSQVNCKLPLELKGWFPTDIIQSCGNYFCQKP